MLGELTFHFHRFENLECISVQNFECIEQTKREKANIQITFFYMGMLIDTHAYRPVPQIYKTKKFCSWGKKDTDNL